MTRQKNIVYSYSYDPRVTIIEKVVNKGISKALNTGFEYLFKLDEVQYLTWGSSDNILYPQFLEKLHDRLKNAPLNVGIVFSCFDHIDANGNFTLNKIEQDYLRDWQQTQKVDDLLDADFIGTSFMYKKSFAQQIQGYYFEPVEDYEYWLRLTEICDFVYILEELMAYRYHSPLSLSKSIHTDKTKHRWWRDQFNLARHMARERRKIPYETTIIFPVSTLDNETIQDIENLLEQLYHNYWLIMIDRTFQLENTLKAHGINDHRITVIASGAPYQTLMGLIETPNTPIKFVYEKQYNFSDISCLTNVIASLKNTKS